MSCDAGRCGVKSYALALVLLLGLAAAAQASRITGDSGYGTAPSIHPCTTSTATISDYGVFTCSGGTEQCGNAPPNPTSYCPDDNCISGNVLSLPLYGTARAVFFVALNDPQDGRVPAEVTASIVGAVPEPQMFPMVGLALFVAFLLYRERRLI